MSKPLPVPMVLDDRAEWFDLAYQAMDTLISRGQPFDADSLRDLVPVPGQPNWVGNVFNAYANQKFIRQTGFTLSRSKSRRGGVIRKWVGVSDARR